MAGGIRSRSRTAGNGKPTGKPNGTGIRSRSRTTVTPPAEVRYRSRTEGSGQTPTRTVPGSALSQTGDVRSRSRTETPVSYRLRGRSRTEGTTPTASAAQLKRLQKALMDIFGQSQGPNWRD